MIAQKILHMTRWECISQWFCTWLSENMSVMTSLIHVPWISDNTWLISMMSLFICVTWLSDIISLMFITTSRIHMPWRSANRSLISMKSQCIRATWLDDIISLVLIMTSLTGWRRPTGCPQWQVIFRKRATKHRALLRKMTCTDKASYDATPPCIHMPWISDDHFTESCDTHE